MPKDDEALETSPSASQQEAQQVEEVRQVRLPPFWHVNPTLWFVQVEAQFHAYSVKSDANKYFTVIGALDGAVLQQVADVLINPPDKDKYHSLKTQLIARFTDSEEKQLRRVLTEIDLGDKSPSQLLREMKVLAREKLSAEVLKTLWLQRLPTQVQLILSASADLKLEKMADVADKITEVNSCTAPGIATISHKEGASFIKTGSSASTSSIATPYTTVSTNSNQQSIAALEHRVAELTKLVEEMARDKYTRRPRNRSRSRSRPIHEEGVCFYHRRFGEKARKCTMPCNFRSTERAQGNDQPRRQ